MLCQTHARIRSYRLGHPAPTLVLDLHLTCAGQLFGPTCRHPAMLAGDDCARTRSQSSCIQ
eukprot:3324643-Pleurochrysis_carterae.AAC.1